MKCKITILLLMLFVSISTTAQNNTSNSSDPGNPIWITMMEDENVNYFEAVKAFESYMKTHEVGEEEVEEELMGGDQAAKDEYEKEMRRENKKIRTEKQRSELVEKEKLAYQIKRFRNWMQEVKPYVQENGHILTQEERMTIWLQQQEEMKKASDKK